MQVMIFCTRPGLVRGGVRHPEFATYFAGKFSGAQLREMLADRNLTVCVGRRLTADGVVEFVDAVSKMPPADATGMGVDAAEGNAASTDEIHRTDAGLDDASPETKGATAAARSVTAAAGGKPRASRRRP